MVGFLKRFWLTKFPVILESFSHSMMSGAMSYQVCRTATVLAKCIPSVFFTLQSGELHLADLHPFGCAFVMNFNMLHGFIFVVLQSLSDG